MGIHGFNTFLMKNEFNEKNSRSSTKSSGSVEIGKMEVKLSELHKYGITRVGIDLSNLLIKFMNHDYKSNVNKISVINQLFNFIHKFTKYNIQLLFVFDGFPGKEKNTTVTERRNLKKKNDERISKLELAQNILNSSFDYYESEDLDDKDFINPVKEEKEVSLKRKIDKIRNQNNNSISRKLYDECKNLFDILGISYIHIRTMEADKVFKILDHYKLIDACFSYDTDMFAYGCKNILMHLDFKYNTLTKFNRNTIINNMGLTEDQFLDFCGCCGTDYAEGIKNIKLDQIINYLKIYKTGVNLINNISLINCELNIHNDNNKSIKLPANGINFKLVRDIFNFEIEISEEDFKKQIIVNKFIKNDESNIMIYVKNVVNNIKSIILDSISDINEKTKYTKKVIEFIEMKLKFKIDIKF